MSSEDRDELFGAEIGKLPVPLQEIFRTEEPGFLDEISAQSLFLIGYTYLHHFGFGVYTVPEISIPNEALEDDSLGTPDKWDEVYWPLDLVDPAMDPGLYLPALGPSELLPFINGEVSPSIDWEPAESDEDAYSYFRISVPYSRDFEEVLKRIKSRPRLKDALIKSAEQLGDYWAAERALACLKSVE